MPPYVYNGENSAGLPPCVCTTVRTVLACLPWVYNEAKSAGLPPWVAHNEAKSAGLPLLPLFPFHCWARVSSLLLYSRFTVGLFPPSLYNTTLCSGFLFSFKPVSLLVDNSLPARKPVSLLVINLRNVKTQGYTGSRNTSGNNLFIRGNRRECPRNPLQRVPVYKECIKEETSHSVTKSVNPSPTNTPRIAPGWASFSPVYVRKGGMLLTAGVSFSKKCH